MWAEDDSNSELPHQGRQRRQRRIEIHRRLKRISDEAASEEAAKNSLPTEDRREPKGPPEASEQYVAARREQEWEELHNELYEIRRADRARRTSSPRDLKGKKDLNGDSDWEQDQDVPNSPQQSSPPHVSGSDSVSPGPNQPASLVEKGPQSTDPEEVNTFDVDGANSPENASATSPRTRWISQKDLEGLIRQGIDLYKSEVTNAVYYLDLLGERVWVVDKNGDCVLAQDQSLD
ncbi:hypothetical protein F5883DRAFT_650688 [Diaporthe sp. PMI_573]|nr:hypothetical protein F5883DRAFT_650688 [Diaporthaceae sp. PMI_573]